MVNSPAVFLHRKSIDLELIPQKGGGGAAKAGVPPPKYKPVTRFFVVRLPCGFPESGHPDSGCIFHRNKAPCSKGKSYTTVYRKEYGHKVPSPGIPRMAGLNRIRSEKQKA